MIMTFFIFLAILIADYEKGKIEFCDKMIYIGEEILILMNSTIPDTNGVFAILKNSEKLRDIDVFDVAASPPLKSSENEKIKDISQNVHTNIFCSWNNNYISSFISFFYLS